jgi:anti-sigma regulatory factor (Ser/Thr protein kinase)
MDTTVAPPLAGELLARRARLPAGAAAAGEARGLVRDAIRAWGLLVDVGDALLLTSELVANGVLHGGGAVTLSVRVSGGRLRVEVYDTSGDLPVPGGDPGGGAVSGRGLLLVETLASEWGSYRCPGGKAVFFTLAPPVDAR